MRAALAILPGLLLAGCSLAVTPEARQAVQASTATPIVAAAPTAKEVIALVFRNAHVRLASDPSCAGVGTSREDQSIGDFLAGFLAEQTGQAAGRNWIEVLCKDAPGGQAPPGWECQMLVRRLDGEERWGWGVRFLVRASDRKAVRQSFRCAGAG